MNVKRLMYFDGLRTIFCFIVLFSHIKLAFFPNSRTLVWNDGNLAVMYFLVLSGGVVALSSAHKSNKIHDVILFILKRYFRLLPIIALSIMFSFLIQMGGGYFNQLVAKITNNDLLIDYYKYYIPFPVAIWDSFVGAFYHRPYLNTPLWTIKYEFFFVIIVYVIESLISKKYKLKVYLIMLILSYLFMRDIYCMAVLFGGMLFNVLFLFDKRKHIRKYWIKALIITMIISMGIVIYGFYPTHFRLLTICILCILISINKNVQKILSNKWLIKLSKYTFAIYAIHWPIICSLTCFLYYYTMEMTVLRLLIFLISFIVILLVAYILELISKKITIILMSNIIINKNVKSITS